MVTLGLPVEVIETRKDTERLSIEVAQELGDLTEKPQPDPQPDCATEIARWCYRMPFPGVRYYSYEE
jgi:hypothetical protein